MWKSGKREKSAEMNLELMNSGKKTPWVLGYSRVPEFQILPGSSPFLIP